MRRVLIGVAALLLMLVAVWRIRSPQHHPSLEPQTPPIDLPAEAVKPAASPPPPGRPAVDRLAVARRSFLDRVDAANVRMAALLRGRRPAEALDLLQRILASPVEVVDGSFTPPRLDRVMAARYLSKVVQGDASLAAPVLGVIKNTIRVESDLSVRLQLVAAVAGVGVQPDVVQFKKGDGEPVFTEILLDGPEDGTEPWLGSLRGPAGEDPEVAEILRQVAANPKDRSRTVALRALLELSTETATGLALDVFDNDPGIRLFTVEALTRSKSPRAFESLSRALPQTSDDLLAGLLANALVEAPRPPPGAGKALLDAFRARAETTQSARFPLVQAAAATYASATDPDALDCVLLALQSSTPKLRDHALFSMARHPAAGYAPILRRELASATEDYARELIGYALARSDSSYRDPNRFVEVDRLKARLNADGLSAQARQSLQSDLEAREKELEDLRTRQ